MPRCVAIGALLIATHLPLLSAQNTAATAAAAACVQDFDSVHVLVTRDYAGYGDRMRESAARIGALTDSVRRDMRQVQSDSVCTAVLQRWIAPFAEHDHHIQLWQPRPRQQPPATPAATPTVDSRRPTLTFLGDSVAVVRLPDFAQRYRVVIDSLVAEHRARLLATPYLVVDVRRNGGGWTGAYTNVMALIYTDPIRRDPMDPWVSEGNLAYIRQMLASADTPEQLKAEIRRMLPTLEAHTGRFFAMDSAGVLRFDTIYAMPRAVAVLTGRLCASSCEQFVLDAMHSRKVTVFGTENTGGFLDYGNVRTITLPSGIRRLAIPTSRARRLPDRPLDKSGIAPQVRIPLDEGDPVGFAVRRLANPGAR